MKQQSSLAYQPRELTVRWAQGIVNRHHQQAKVFDVKLHEIDVGTSTRLRIEVEHDAADSLPKRWFVKTPSLALKSRVITALPRFLHKEVNFYRCLSAQLPVRLPPLLAAENRFGKCPTLVLSDLTEAKLTPGRAGEALSPEQAGQVIDQLANLHGHFQDNRSLLNHRWLHGFSEQIENHMGSLLATPLMKRGLKQAENAVHTKLHAPALRYAANRRHYKRLLKQGPQTLVHYDCHPGNLFWNGLQPGFLDWQLVRLGEGIGDVAYFLATALQPELRRLHENSLINRYAAKLSANGVKNLDEEYLLDRYRKHLVYPFEAMVVTLAIGDMMEQSSNLEMIKRAAAAVDDHDSFQRLFA